MEECHNDMVAEIQKECVLSKAFLINVRDFTYPVPNSVKPQFVDESIERCHGRLGHMGDSKWRTEADH